MSKLFLVGILNVTPDSFSDGGEFLDTKAAIEHARVLKGQGAAIIDVGADSSRPGSICVGEEEEWRRLQPVLASLEKDMTVSVDTHFVGTAEKAIRGGAKIINDISGGSAEMFKLAADTGTSVVIMYSRCSQPHVFDLPVARNLIADIKSFFDRQCRLATSVGLPKEQIIFDPGMGGFISDKAGDSAALVDAIGSFEEYRRLFIGISRKGFLKKLFPIENAAPAEDSNERLDRCSVDLTKRLMDKMPQGSEVYLRVHNVALHAREFPWFTPRLD